MQIIMINVETPKNYEQKCLCVLLLDNSYSMTFNGRIEELQKGIEIFHQEIMEDPTTSNRLEVAIIRFGGTVEVMQQPALVNDFRMPKLIADGATPMKEAIEEAIGLVNARKSWYKLTGQPYYRPWIIAITDGGPTDVINFKDLHDKIQKEVDNKSFFFFAIGVEDADMEKLQKISSTQMSAAKLTGLKFAEFFTWLSASMTQVTSSHDGDIINMPSPADWMDGFKID